MKLTDFVTEDHVLFLPPGLDGCGAIRHIVMSAPYFQSEKWSREQRESLVLAVLKREELGSTAIGGGHAVPHTKHPNACELVGFFACSKAGVEFRSLDGELVHFVWFHVSPPDRPGDHLRYLEAVTRTLTFVDKRTVKEILSARTERHLVEVLASLDRRSERR